MRRSSPRTQDDGKISLFPFLAVLLCMMGSLLVLLIIVSQRAQASALEEQAAQHAALPAAAAPVVDEQKAAEQREKLRSLIAALQDARDKLSKRMSTDRQALSHLEDHARRLRDDIEKLRSEAALLAQTQTAEQKSGSDAQREAQRVEQLADEAARLLEEAQKNANTGQASYSVIPYDGPNPTRRRPIYLECRPHSIVIQPEGIVLNEEDFDEPLGPNNPLAVALRAASEHLARHSPDPGGAAPYPLLIVRPSSIMAYYAARAALQSWGEDFGYEMVDEEWKIKYLPPDPQMAEVLESSVSLARRRMEIERSVSGGSGRGTGFADGNGRDGEGRGRARGASQFRRGLGGGMGDGAATGEGSGTGTGRAGGGNGQGTRNQAGEGNGSRIHGPKGTNGTTGAQSGGAQSGGAQSGGAQSGGAQSGGAQSGGAQSGGAQSGGAQSGGAQSGGAQSGGAQSGGAQSGGAQSGGAQSGGAQSGGAQGAHQSTGESQGGGAAGGGPTDGQGGQQQMRLGEMSPPVGKTSSSRGTAQSASSGSAGSGGGTPPPGAENMQSLAATRGENWALPGASQGSIGVTRPLRIEAAADRIVIDSGNRGGRQVIACPGGTEQVIEQFVSTVWEQMRGWGIAGRGLYWRPVLNVYIIPGGEQRTAELARLLEESGLEVKVQP